MKLTRLTFILLSASLLLLTCKKETSNPVNQPQTNEDPVTAQIYKNTTGNPDAEGVQFVMTDAQSGLRIFFYGRFGENNLPSTTTGIVVTKANSDTTVCFLLDSAKNIHYVFLTANSSKQPLLSKITYNADSTYLHSIYQYNWETQTDSLLYRALVKRKADGSYEATPIYEQHRMSVSMNNSKLSDFLKNPFNSPLDDHDRQFEDEVTDMVKRMTIVDYIFQLEEKYKEFSQKVSETCDKIRDRFTKKANDNKSYEPDEESNQQPEAPEDPVKDANNPDPQDDPCKGVDIKISGGMNKEGSVYVNATGGNAPYLFKLRKGNELETAYQSNSYFYNNNSQYGQGSYSFFVKDNSGCIQVLRDITLTPANCEGVAVSATADGGTLTVSMVNGEPPYKFSVDESPFSTQTTYTDLSKGTHTVIGKDYKDCLDQTSVEVTNPCKYSTLKIQASANGSTITASATGGKPDYLFSIDGTNYSSSGTFANLSDGTYTVSCKDKNECLKSTTVKVITCTSLSLSATAKGNTITITASGGSTPYRYSVDGNTYQSSGTFTNLDPGIYTVSVKDNKDCTFSKNVTLTFCSDVNLTKDTYYYGGHVISDGKNILMFNGNGTNVTAKKYDNQGVYKGEVTYSNILIYEEDHLSRTCIYNGDVWFLVGNGDMDNESLRAIQTNSSRQPVKTIDLKINDDPDFTDLISSTFFIKNDIIYVEHRRIDDDNDPETWDDIQAVEKYDMSGNYLGDLLSLPTSDFILLDLIYHDNYLWICYQEQESKKHYVTQINENGQTVKDYDLTTITSNRPWPRITGVCKDIWIYLSDDYKFYKLPR